VDNELKKLLQETVTIAPYSSRNDDNEFSYGTGVSVACRLQHKKVVIPSDTGRDVISSCQIYVDGTTTVSTNSKITLASGVSPVILAIYDTPDENGETYYRCIYT